MSDPPVSDPQTLTERIRTLVRLERFHRMARLTLLTRPPGANELIADVPELRAILTSGEGVVEIISPRGSEGFIVAEGGQRRTYDELPPHIDPARVVKGHLRVERVLETRLRELAEEIEARDPTMYEDCHIAQILDAVESYERLDHAVADAVVLADVLAEVQAAESVNVATELLPDTPPDAPTWLSPDAPPDASAGLPPDDDAQARAWADAVNAAVSDRYVRLLIPVPAAADIKAACLTMSVDPKAAWLRRRLLPAIPPDMFERLDPSDPSESIGIEAAHPTQITPSPT
ncbi:hypothetical protein ACFQ9X_20780 [Catenulispora yoronensis]